MFLSGSVSNNQITAIFYQASYRNIQKAIGLAMQTGISWYFREGFLEEEECAQSADIRSSTLIPAL